MTHTWDPDRYLAYADERGRPFVELVARVGADATRATVVDLGCGPGNLTALLAERWPGRARHRPRRQPRDGRRGPRARRTGIALRRRRPARLGRRAGRARSTSSSPTPPCSGCPATSSCCPRLVGAGRARAAGWRSRCPATSTSPATRSAASWPTRRRTPPTPAASPRPPATTRRRTSTALAAPRLHGRRLGDDLPARPHRRGPGLHLGLRHRRPARRSRRCPTTCAPTSRREFKRAAARRRTRPRRTAWCCRSAGSSSSRRVPA